MNRPSLLRAHGFFGLAIQAAAFFAAAFAEKYGFETFSPWRFLLLAGGALLAARELWRRLVLLPCSRSDCGGKCRREGLLHPAYRCSSCGRVEPVGMASWSGERSEGE